MNSLVVLMIGSDRSMFDAGSAAALRLQAQAKLFDEAHVIVFSLRRHGLQKTLRGNVHLYPTNSRSRLLYIWDAIVCGRAVPKATVVSCQDPFESGLAGWSVARRGLPLQLQVHTDLFSPYFLKGSLLNRIRIMLAYFLIPRATCVRVVSSRIERSITERGLAENISVLPVYAALAEASLEEVETLRRRFEKFQKIVLVVSRLEKEKNVAASIRTFAQIVATHPKAGLIIVGEGRERRRLENLVKNLGLKDRVIFEGARPAAPYFKVAQVLLQCSWYEGYGLSIIEALAAGCPVVAFDVGIAREAGAIVVTQKELPESLSEVLTDPPSVHLNITLPTQEEYMQQYRDLLVSCGAYCSHPSV